MKEKRSLFSMIFGKAKEPIQQQQQTSLQMLTGFTPQFSSPSTNASEYAVVRTSIDAVARNAAKLKPKHVRRVNGNVTIPNSNLDYLLSVRPNPHMDAYSFYYKMFSQVYYKNNAFAYVEYDEAGNHKAIYPIDFSRMELLEFKNEMYIQFHFISGKKLTLPYTEVIHIRRFFVSHDIYGDTTDSALQKALELIHTTDEGVMNAVKSSAYLRGLLKFPTVLKESDLKQSRNLFVEEFMDMNKKGGIAAIDSRAEYVDLKSDPKMVSAEQMRIIEDKIYKYFNVNEAIVKSDFTTNQWNAFYESVIEPLAIQMSLEFTAKLFTKREQGWGNEIIFESNRLQYAEISEKISVVQTLMDRGMMSINEGLDVFNMPPIEGGEKRIMSLNFVDKDIANQYQLGKKDADVKPKATEGGQDNGDPIEG